jgi:hypothetical protein
MRITTISDSSSLNLDMLRYGRAILTQYNYANSFRDYNSKVGHIIECVDFGSMEDLDEWLKLPIFDLSKDTEFSPNLSETEINSLKDPDLFTKKELLAMVNTLLIEKLSKETEEDERLNRHGNDNATVSDTELQGRRDTYKEKE